MTRHRQAAADSEAAKNEYGILNITLLENFVNENFCLHYIYNTKDKDDEGKELVQCKEPNFKIKKLNKNSYPLSL